MKNLIRSVAVAIASIAILASSSLCAPKIDTTATRDPVAPKKSTAKTILSAPGFIIKIPVKVLKGVAKTGLRVAYEDSPIKIFFKNLFGTNRPYHPLISYGSKPSLMGGIGFRFREVWKTEDQIRVKVWYSVNKYQRYQLRYESPYLFGERTGFALRGAYDRMPRESFYGLGNDSREEDESSITQEISSIEGELEWRAGDDTRLIFTSGYASYNLYDGEETAIFTDLDMIADSLGVASTAFRGARLMSLGARFRYDWRNHRGQPSSGGTEEIAVSVSRGTGASDGLTYWEAEVDLRQYLHLFRKRTLAARVLVRTMDIINDDNYIGLAYYLLPVLGGQDDLRGYRRNRFLGRGLAVGSLEYRYPLFQGGDAFLFIDEGRVFGRVREDFTFRDWRYSFGIGIRGWGDEGERFRFTVARSKEEIRFYLNFGQDL